MEATLIKALSPRKREILAAARSLFNHKGYQAASMRDLAEVLDIRPASLYSHYPSKEEMLWEIAIRGARAFHQAVLPVAKRDQPIPARLREMIRLHIQVMIENRSASAIFFREWRHLAEPRRSEYAALIAQYEAAFSAQVEAGIQAGLFRSVSPRFTTLMLLSSLNWIQRWYQPGGEIDLEAIAEEAADFVLAGLLRSPSA